jgi:hypothetical protein
MLSPNPAHVFDIHRRKIGAHRLFLQLVARVEAQLRQRDGWIMAEMEAARSNDLLNQAAADASIHSCRRTAVCLFARKEEPAQ